MMEGEKMTRETKILIQQFNIVKDAIPSKSRSMCSAIIDESIETIKFYELLIDSLLKSKDIPILHIQQIKTALLNKNAIIAHSAKDEILF